MRYQISEKHRKLYTTKGSDGALHYGQVNSATIVSSIVEYDDIKIIKMLNQNINSTELKQIFRYAIINSKIELVKLCLQKNASINSALPFRKKFVLPLEIAQINADADLIQLLLQYGAHTAAEQKENAKGENIAAIIQEDLALGGEDAEF